MSQAAKHFGLSETISALRAEMYEAINKGKNDKLRFKIKEIGVELKCTAKSEETAGGGIKFWVINLASGFKIADEAVHTISIKLHPILDENDDVQLSDIDTID